MSDKCIYVFNKLNNWQVNFEMEEKIFIDCPVSGRFPPEYIYILSKIEI